MAPMARRNLGHWVLLVPKAWSSAHRKRSTAARPDYNLTRSCSAGALRPESGVLQGVKQVPTVAPRPVEGPAPAPQQSEPAVFTSAAQP